MNNLLPTHNKRFKKNKIPTIRHKCLHTSTYMSWTYIRNFYISSSHHEFIAYSTKSFSFPPCKLRFSTFQTNSDTLLYFLICFLLVRSFWYLHYTSEHPQFHSHIPDISIRYFLPNNICYITACETLLFLFVYGFSLKTAFMYIWLDSDMILHLFSSENRK